MNIKVFARLQGKKIRCEILDCFEHRITKKSYIIIFAPFFAEKDILIPLIFDPNITNQVASFLVDKEDIEIIENIINKDACVIQYSTDEDITFEILILQEMENNALDEVQKLAKSLGLLTQLPFNIDEDAKKAIDAHIIRIKWQKYVSELEQNDFKNKNVVSGLILDIVKPNISLTLIPLSNFDNLLSSDEIILSSEDILLGKSFEGILKAFGKSEIIRQDVENALVSFAECDNCTNTLFNTIIKNKAFTEKFSQDILQNIQNKVVLRVPNFFETTKIKAAANYYYSKKEYDNSLILYQQLYARIKNESNNEEIINTLNSIGCCYVGIMQFDNACSTFRQITEIDNTYATAYNNWAYALSVECDTLSERDIRQVKLQEALQCVNDAIQYDNKEVSFISNKAFIEYELGRYDQVIRDLDRARKISTRYTDISTILKLAIDSKIRLSIISPQQTHLNFLDLYDDLCLIYDNETNGNKLYFEALDIYNKICNSENNEKGKQLIEELILLEFYVKELMASITVQNPHQEIYYYTSIGSLHRLLCDEAEPIKYRLPIFSANHMNDPSEGKELEKVLREYVSDETIIKDLFNNPKGITKSNRSRLESEFTFLKAFTKNVDSLPMWVHYADTCKGCCVRVSHRFFTNFDNDLSSDEKALINNPFDNEYLLYEILYIQNGQIANKVSDEVNELYKSMLDKFSCVSSIYCNVDQEIRNAVISAISKIINKLKYLFKSVDYIYEQEMRFVLKRPLADLKRDDIDIQMTPITKDNTVPKIYIYTNKSLLIEEVILGPKVNETDDIVPFLEWKLLKLNNYETDKVTITKSEIEYR